MGLAKIGDAQVATLGVLLCGCGTGDAPVDLDGVVPGNPFDSSAFGFDIDRVDLPPSVSAVLTVSFSPAIEGQTESVLVVRFTDRGEAATLIIRILGRGVA